MRIESAPSVIGQSISARVEEAVVTVEAAKASPALSSETGNRKSALALVLAKQSETEHFAQEPSPSRLSTPADTELSVFLQSVSSLGLKRLNRRFREAKKEKGRHAYTTDVALTKLGFFVDVMA